jgi:hypothetical protein
MRYGSGPTTAPTFKQSWRFAAAAEPPTEALDAH